MNAWARRAQKPPGLAGGLDRGLLDVSSGALELRRRRGANGDEPDGAQDAVAGGEAGFILEDVGILGALSGVLDLPDAGALGGVGDVGSAARTVDGERPEQLSRLLGSLGPAGRAVGARHRCDERTVGVGLLETMKDYRFEASWAVWGSVRPGEAFDAQSDLRLPVEQGLDGVLHARDVLIGLNRATIPRDARGRALPTDEGVPWSDFHTSAFHNDHFLAEAFRGTDVWGAYMTDLHEQRESDATKVHEQNLDAEIVDLVTQLRLLGAVGDAAPRLICFGAKAYDRVIARVTAITVEIGAAGPLRVVRAPHWSRANGRVHRAQISRYRDLVQAAIA